MTAPTIENGSKYFTTTLYEGNGTAIGSGGKTISGLEFKPDLAWIKNRDATDSHSLYDSSRGVTKQIEPDDTSAQTTESEGLTSFTSDGFTLGSLDQVNTNNESFVSWNWKANGGTTASNSDGSITSTVEVNSTSKFSIVQWTGTGSNATIGHGLGKTPDLIIFRSLTNTSGTGWWVVWTKDLGGANKVLYLNTDNAVDTSTTMLNNTLPTSSVFSVGANYNTNDGGAMVAYCWAEVEGFSSFGKYSGNSSADGTFIQTNHSPSFIMIKETTNTNNWYLWDSQRSPINPMSNRLVPDGNYAEVSDRVIDVLANGFKFRENDHAHNGAGRTYIYCSFASNPFFATVPATAR